MKGTDKVMVSFPVIAGFILLMLIGFTSPVQCQGEELPVIDKTINISPNIINLASSDHSFGIHTNIWYSSIDTRTVQILCADGITVMDDEVYCHADSRGYLIAESTTMEIEDFCAPPDGEYYLILTGESFLTLADPYAFYGEGEVMIISGKPQFGQAR